MTHNVIENYYKSTTSDFNKLYINSNDNNNENNVSKEVARSKLEQITSVQKDNTVQKSLQNPQISTPRNINILKSIFRGFCYYTIAYNKCLKNDCCFRHDVCI